NVPLVYAGVPRQRKLLEMMDGRENPDLAPHWNYLDVTDLNSDTAVVSSQLYQSFSRGSYGLADIAQVGMGRLRDYFSAILDSDSGKEPTPRQRAEYAILNYYFDVEKDFYFSIPLVMFGEFDGIMHFVYTEADARNVKPRSLGGLIRSSSAMLETQALEWDLVGRNPEKSKAILMPLDPGFYKNVNRNPILRELEFEKYYRRYLGFYQARIHFNDDIIHSKVYRPYLRTAIISIMIDSFAHNVSAHSLVALNWWFKQRAENLRGRLAEHTGDVAELREIVNEYLPDGFERDRLFELLSPWIRGLFVKDADPAYDLVNFPGPLAREVQPLLKFLMQKGAFWSGIARDNHFGGESASLFEVLWTDFVNNPLYLGTIAKSEDIHRVRIRVILYEPFSLASINEEMPCHRPKKVLLEGEFIEIDLEHQRPAMETDEHGQVFLPCRDGRRFYCDAYPELRELSDFVRPGFDYPLVKQILEECELFFPGEVVGRHAFFTLLENEIRNVKHYKGAALRKIQEEGLELVLSLQEAPVRHDVGGDKALCRLGVWINTPANMELSDGTLLLQHKFAALREGIMDPETFAPRLGGGFQDKLCAGMLFNNRFQRVQNGDESEMRDRTDDTDRDRHFYPWIIPASGPADNPHQDIEFNFLAFRQWENFLACYDHSFGYLKKYFYVWKAADVRSIHSAGDADFIWDNLARFRFVGLNGPEDQQRELFDLVRAQGVLRIIKGGGSLPPGRDERLTHAYDRWLPTWLGDEPFNLQLRVDRAMAGAFHFRPGAEQRLTYWPEWQMDDAPRASVSATLTIDLAHGGESTDPQLLRYRSHGVYKKYFLPALEPGKALSSKAAARMAELFEVLATRITIFDSRIYYRIRHQERRQTLEEQLFLQIRDESTPRTSDNWLSEWEEQKAGILASAHFMVLHLSFIEKILLTKYNDHEEFADENIGLFIQEEIIPHVTHDDGTVRDNFILVITTGRGRSKWWTRLNEHESYQSFRRFTVFRPVESIISAVEDAINRKDDIELKYNLVKVMFGS
ncbi:MAG: hypothetical protein KDC54_13830, partial [Lewinella sp.]|nr:hypothetical protein [Lewinella sp.]